MSRCHAAAAALLLLGLGLPGCGEARQRTAADLPARGYHPERFPDIPLAPTFVLEPDRDQLAIAVGGGLIRRFDVGLVQKAQAKHQSPEEVLAWYATMLPALGWTAMPGGGNERSFRRDRSPEVAELLHIRARAASGVTSLELRLEPAAPKPTTP